MLSARFFLSQYNCSSKYPDGKGRVALHSKPTYIRAYTKFLTNSEFIIIFIWCVNLRRCAGTPYSHVPAHKNTDHIFDARPMTTEEVPFAWHLNRLRTHLVQQGLGIGPPQNLYPHFTPPKKLTIRIHTSIHPYTPWAGSKPAIPVLQRR